VGRAANLLGSDRRGRHSELAGHWQENLSTGMGHTWSGAMRLHAAGGGSIAGTHACGEGGRSQCSANDRQQRRRSAAAATGARLAAGAIDAAPRSSWQLSVLSWSSSFGGSDVCCCFGIGAESQACAADSAPGNARNSQQREANASQRQCGYGFPCAVHARMQSRDWVEGPAPPPPPPAGATPQEPQQVRSSPAGGAGFVRCGGLPLCFKAAGQMRSWPSCQGRTEQ
jgi:hypothetical protein